MDAQKLRKRFLLLQVNDALFPIGAYSHSYGLETYIQKNLIKTADDAWEFISRRLLYGFCYNEFLSARLAFEYASKNDLEQLNKLENELTAFHVPREIREAAQKLASRFVKTVNAMEVSFESDIFLRYCNDRKETPMIYSIVYGVFCAAAGMLFEDAMENFIYSQTSSMVTNCVKTIPLSQTDGQKLLYRGHRLFQEVLERLNGLDKDDLCLSVPGFDIRSMQHEGLYSRIYMS